MAHAALQQQPANECAAFRKGTFYTRFNRYKNIVTNGLSYHSGKPLADLRLTRGAQIVDVGCGWGETAIVLAHKTGPQGDVLGIDDFGALLQHARDAARKHGVPNVEFVRADVRTHAFAPTRSVFCALQHAVPGQLRCCPAERPPRSSCPRAPGRLPRAIRPEHRRSPPGKA